MAMFVCKNVGCAFNYCSVIKMGHNSDWTGSKDCMDEFRAVNKCITDE